MDGPSRKAPRVVDSCQQFAEALLLDDHLEEFNQCVFISTSALNNQKNMSLLVQGVFLVVQLDKPSFRDLGPFFVFCSRCLKSKCI